MKKATVSTEARTYILRKMRQLLQSGVTKLPTERELAAEVAASYPTVRLVMAELEAQGYIRRVRGSGTYLQPQAAELLKPKLLLITSPLVSDVDRSYASYCVRELENAARINQFKLRIQQVTGHDAFLRELAAAGNEADAVVYLPPTKNFTMQQLGLLAEFDTIPLAVIDMDMGNIEINNIVTDNYRGGMLAAQTLLRAGRRNLVLLQTEPPTRQCRQRMEGFREMAGLSGCRVEVIDCGVNAEDDRVAKTFDVFGRILKTGAQFDGVFCISDTGAFGACRALTKNGITIGQETALLGFDGLPAGRKAACSLASIAQPVKEIAAEVFTMIRNWQRGTYRQSLLLPTLQPGATLGNAVRTSAVPAAADKK